MDENRLIEVQKKWRLDFDRFFEVQAAFLTSDLDPQENSRVEGDHLNERIELEDENPSSLEAAKSEHLCFSMNISFPFGYYRRTQNLLIINLL